jgi:peroxiredoxin
MGHYLSAAVVIIAKDISAILIVSVGEVSVIGQAKQKKSSRIQLRQV